MFGYSTIRSPLALETPYVLDGLDISQLRASSKLSYVLVKKFI
jgi:hypothetical protein